MQIKNPANAAAVRKMIDDRLRALDDVKDAQETVNVEWRGAPRSIPVISMPIELLYYNPDTHRIRAQRSANKALEKDLDAEPYGAAAQSYLHQLLMGDPADPSKVDPSFTALKDDLQLHGQSEPGIITRFGVLINGNTRRAALKELGVKNIRVGVLPADAGHEDLQAIELLLQLRKDLRREYSFMNFLLAIEERVVAGQQPVSIQSDFRIQATTYERCRWILDFVRSAIERSKVTGADGREISLGLVDFEAHQGKLEELYRAYMALKKQSPDQAEALREQRLLALVLNKSKTDLRLIEPDFVQKYMKSAVPEGDAPAAAPQRIPGTSIEVAGPSAEVQRLRALTTAALQAKSVSVIGAAQPESAKASDFLSKLDDSLVKGLDLAGKQARVVKRRLAAIDRISDACDDLELAVAAVAEARATGNFKAAELDDTLVSLKRNLAKLAAIVNRDVEVSGEGGTWLRALVRLEEQSR